MKLTKTKIIALISDEVIRSKMIHPNWVEDYIHGAGVVCEESGELMKAALNHEYFGDSKDKMKEEAIHTAATAIRFLENL